MTQKSTRFFSTSFLLIFLTFFIQIQFSYGQSKVDKLDELLDLYNEYGQFNGSVLVAQEGEVVYKKGFGMANMEWDIPNLANTKHRLGSITKQFTAMLIMQLVAEGKLNLETPVSDYLPDYPKETGDIINIHHLMTHTSGIPNYTSFPGFFNNDSRDPYTPEEFVKVFADSTLNFVPGEQFSYSNSGYFLLGVIIEKVTGKTYEQMLQENIFAPLGMNDTGYDHHGVILKNRATGYEKNGNSYVNSNYLDMSIPYAAGAMYSTVEDLFLWDQALYTDKLLPEKYKEMIFQEHIDAFGGAYGYGWSIRETAIGNSDDRQTIVGHGGGINGFNTTIDRAPSDKSLVLLLNNTGGAALGEMSAAIFGILHGKTYDMPKKSVAYALKDKIETDGIAAGLEYFKEIKGDENYALKEGEINRIGYQFLQADQVEEALAVFKLNIEAYPESWNVYDSYGEALLVNGEQEKGIEYYKKSIELNPGNQNGIDILKGLDADTSDLVEEVVIADDVLKSYIGQYELAPGFILTVTKDGSQMSAQATGQPAALIYPKSENVFYLKVVAAQLTFNKGDDGSIESVTLNQGGAEMIGEKLRE